MRAFIRMYVAAFALWAMVAAAWFFMVYRLPQGEFHLIMIVAKPGGYSLELQGWYLVILVLVLLLLPPAAFAAAALALHRVARRPRNA